MTCRAALSRRGLVLGLGAWGVAGVAAAQDVPPPADQPASELDQALALLPNVETRLSTAVMLNGRGPFQFVVDTGANRTTISQQLALQLRLPEGPLALVHGLAAAEAAPTALIARLRLGEGLFRNILAPTFPQARLAADGLLGLDVLGYYRLVFDHVNGRLLIDGRGGGVRVLRGSGFGTRIPPPGLIQGRQKFGMLTVIPARIDGVEAEAFIDTGSQYTIGNRALLEAIHTRRPDPERREFNVPLIGATGQTAPGRLAVVRSLGIGTAEFVDHPVLFADLHTFDVWEMSDRPALILGADVIRGFSTVEMDLRRNWVRFGPLMRG
ncbi:retroviral-like aspartic protease family protein [Brevundimonas sp. 2R-24]|uniref:Retroviral-like aspartic protease family protein n=1 Tax=Peiella sedimenti TaxID=3061083 RepID=A0ABT8SL90_9CAUL|nr:retroviral-like aspartic protease family protein [Caulobacteraceae bacterium XZ-24]